MNALIGPGNPVYELTRNRVAKAREKALADSQTELAAAYSRIEELEHFLRGTLGMIDTIAQRLPNVGMPGTGEALRLYVGAVEDAALGNGVLQ